MVGKSIFITGGAGYCGSRLVPQLISKGHKVTVYDTMYFGDNFLPKSNHNLNVINGDIRDIQKMEKACQNHDIFVHLACISNDASFSLDEKLSTTINFDAFEPIVIAAKRSKIKRLDLFFLIYFSGSLLYGFPTAFFIFFSTSTGAWFISTCFFFNHYGLSLRLIMS